MPCCSTLTHPRSPLLPFRAQRIEARLSEAVASKDINAIKSAQQAAGAFNMPDLVLEANAHRTDCGNKVRMSKKQRKDQKRLKKMLAKGGLTPEVIEQMKAAAAAGTLPAHGPRLRRLVHQPGLLLHHRRE